MSEGGKKGEKQIVAQPPLLQAVRDTYHSINLCRAHHPRHLIKLLGRHGEQVFWRLEPGRVADGEGQGLSVTTEMRHSWATLSASKA